MTYEHTTIIRIVAEAAERNAADTANTSVVREEAISDCIEAYRCDRLADAVPDLDGLLAAHFEAQIRGSLKRNTQTVRRAMESGQTLADLGDNYDLPITVCGPEALKSLIGMRAMAGRTTTLGNLTADDIDLTVEELRIAYEKQKKSYYSSRDTAGLWVVQLRQFPSYRAWREAAGEESA